MPFNVVLNDPKVHPFVTLGTGKLDVAPLVDDPNNVLLMAKGGGIIFVWREPGIYEVHTAFLKPDRAEQSQAGPYIRNVCLAAYRWMFTRTLCTTLHTFIPVNNRPALWLAPAVGWTKEFERKGIWPGPNGEAADVTFWSIYYDDWVRKTPELMESGRWFHERLLEEMRRHGHVEPLHADDGCHDLHVGACAEMIFGGQIEKAVVLYNRWARFAGYGLIGLVSMSPCLLDIGDALLQITGGTFKVIRCP